ncbi:ALF repeat-containing protein [Streptomyces sp. NPDC005752]|uniref:ALF repeat-containing protein n=1 Tax=Streptomyces sp. NPDC005752 TaxID=3157065 RepID=UPI0033C86C78
MRPTRAVLTVAAAALLPALVLAGPAFAAGPASSPPPAATARTVFDSPTTPVGDLSDDDLRVAILRILADEDSGTRVVREANEVLDNGTTEAMRQWLETGYPLAQAEDDRVALFRILARPDISDALRAAVGEAIDGTPEEMRYFLEYGQYEIGG